MNYITKTPVFLTLALLLICGMSSEIYAENKSKTTTERLQEYRDKALKANVAWNSAVESVKAVGQLIQEKQKQIDDGEVHKKVGKQELEKLAEDLKDAKKVADKAYDTLATAIEVWEEVKEASK